MPAEPSAAAEYLQRATAGTSPVSLLSNLVSTVWIAVIHGFGLAEAHDLPVEKMLVLAFGLGFVGFLLNLL